MPQKKRCTFATIDFTGETQSCFFFWRNSELQECARECCLTSHNARPNLVVYAVMKTSKTIQLHVKERYMENFAVPQKYTLSRSAGAACRTWQAAISRYGRESKRTAFLDCERDRCDLQRICWCLSGEMHRTGNALISARKFFQWCKYFFWVLA